VIFTFLCLLVSIASQASVVESIDSELRSKFNCKDRHIQEFCYLSIDQRRSELLVYMSSAATRGEKFIEKTSSYDATNFAHNLYWSITEKFDELRNQNSDEKKISDFQSKNDRKIILVLEVIYQDERIVIIHDNDNTAHIELDKRIDIYSLLKEHRTRVNKTPKNTFERKNLEKGQTSFERYQTTTTYNIASADAEMDMDSGEVTMLEEYSETDRQVSYTKTIFYMAWFPKDDKP